jgi:hypothetical protein
MALRKMYVGTLGPFEYDDADNIDDADGDFSGEQYNSLVTTGQVRLGEAATDAMHAVRKNEADLAITLAHQQNTDTILDDGGVNEVSAAEIRTDVDRYSTGTFTITGTGFTAVVNATARYVKQGALVLLYLPLLSGTSNATTFTLTGIPAAITPTRNSFHPVRVIDNSVSFIGLILLTASSAVFDVFVNADAGVTAWTAAGAKSLRVCTIAYALL